jgi:hypothetical protein
VGTTNGLFLPFPELTETADGPDAYSRLANAVEDYVYDRVLPAGVTRYPVQHWGSGTTYPTTGNGVRAGDTYLHTGLASMMRYTGTAWAQANGPVAMTIAARQTMTTNYSAALPAGFQVIETDTPADVQTENGLRFVAWTGTQWRLLKSEKLNATDGLANGLANAAWGGTTYGWVAGLGGKVTIPADGVRRAVSVIAGAQIVGDGWLRIRRDLGTGTSAYWPNATGLRSTAATEDRLTFMAGEGLDGSTSATYYLEARAQVAAAPSIFVPQMLIEAR